MGLLSFLNNNNYKKHGRPSRFLKPLLLEIKPFLDKRTKEKITIDRKHRLRFTIYRNTKRYTLEYIYHSKKIKLKIKARDFTTVSEHLPYDYDKIRDHTLQALNML